MTGIVPPEGTVIEGIAPNPEASLLPKGHTIIEGIAQGSDEWKKLRMAKVTASCISDIMAKGEGKVRDKYRQKLIGEILSGNVEEEYYNSDMKRGNEEEGDAVAVYEALYNCTVRRITMIDCITWAASPDGLVGEEGLVEAKSRKGSVQIAILEADRVPPANVKQIQANLMASGRKWLDYISYSKGLPLFVKRVYPDLQMHMEIKAAIDQFNAEMWSAVKAIRARYKV